MRSGTIAALAVAVVGAAAAGLVLAQSPTPARPTPHEDLPVPRDPQTPIIGDTKPGKTPSAITSGDKVLPKPKADAPATKSEPVLGKGGFAADRQTEMRPDSNTGPDSTLHYVSVFNPDVLPFKRMSTFDAVRDDESLFVNRTVLTELPVGGTTDAKSRDRFWGDVVVQLRPGVDVPLPSVAPDMRVLSYEVTPKIRLVFSKDGADNFYVRSDENSASGQYRLIFLADADAGYFAPSLPKVQYKPYEILARTPPELRPNLSPRVRAEAMRVLRDKIKVDDHYDLNIAFNALVSYFRAFEPKDITNPTADIYRDLCESQAGVCRHRSFAFMITANALGIPTRYVENEAHAFVEVWFPERNWQRIDLGGAALRMEVTGADNKTLHRPRADDPFAKPPEYKKNYTQLEGEIKGLSDQQIADKRKSLDQSPPSGAIGPGKGNGTGNGSADFAKSPDRITPDGTLEVVPNNPNKPTPSLLITYSDTSGYRGSLMKVEGLVRVGEHGLGDHLVRIFLAPAGKSGVNSIEIGHAMTNADGTFRVDVPIPQQLGLQAYEVYLTSDEDAHYNAAKSQ